MSNITFDDYDNEIYNKLLYFNGFLALTIGGFGIYITWFWSPKIFGAYKYFLFNIAVWAYMFDVYTVFLYFPRFFYPAMLHCPIGLLKTKSPFWAQIWYDVIMTILTGTGIAVLSAFIYRYALLKDNLQVILNWKFTTFLVFLHLFVQAPNWLFLHICGSDTALITSLIIQVITSKLPLKIVILALPQHQEIFSGR